MLKESRRNHSRPCQVCGTAISDPVTAKERFCSLSCAVEHGRGGRARGARGCVLWTGRVEPRGYGLVRFSGKVIKAHRAAWIVEHGAIPDGMLIRHSCDVKTCVNIKHLSLGVRADNARDAAERGRMPRGERHFKAKLTEADVREIRALLPLMPRTHIAKRFGVAAQTIDSIALGRGWGWLK